MSMSPYMFRNMLRPLRIFEQQMQMMEDLLPAIAYPAAIRNQRQLVVEGVEKNECITNDDKQFQVKLDVQNFAPEEITVKTAPGNAIIIEGKHEEKDDNKGFLSRQFVRKFVLSEDHDLKEVVSSLSSDGILTITAPKKGNDVSQERVIPISYTEADKIEKKAEN